ncbi:MAG: reverse transcriptase domain-containing protein [Candidatus Contendobacter sp.]|nr:reverse transcriptase domain-containing protein [Candidatus Contendobacter sp.]
MGKVYRDLYPALTDFQNLLCAYRKAASGKRRQSQVAGFEFEREKHLLQLQRELRAKTYRPGPYQSFYIRDPKRRLVSAAPFRDRVVHHALCNIIEPLFERTFIGDSYANRVGKGTHRALDRAQAFARRYRYVLQCDVREFFPSVDHAGLRAVIARTIADPDVLWLIDAILDNGADVLRDEYTMVYFPGDDLFAINRPRGLPIGNLTSQFWANVYLNELDQLVKRVLRCPAYLRYVDDFLLFADDKPTLWAWKKAVRECLAELRLTLHERSSTVYPVTAGIPFLGFRLYPAHRRLRRRNGVAFSRRLRRWRAAVARGDMDLKQMGRQIQGWVAHAAHGDTWGLRRALLSRHSPPGGRPS